MTPALLAPPAPVTPPALPKPPLPVATVDDLDWCTCTVPLDGTRPHRIWCDLRAGNDWEPEVDD